MVFDRRLVCLLALLMTFIVEAPTHSAARLTVVDETKASHVDNDVLVIDLMQFHHVNSPYAKSDLTLEQRVEIAVKSSLARGQYFHNLIFGETSNFDDKAVFTSPVRFQGSYLMQIRLGTPARTFLAIADTGSDLVWVKSSPCSSCSSQPDPIFDPAASSTYGTVPCSGNAFCTGEALIPTPPPSCSATATCLYVYAYGTGATAGDLATETATLTTTSGATQAFPNFVFGSSHDNTADFDGVDGLVGLGRGILSLVSQLGPQFGNVFSYCLVDFLRSTTKTSPLLLGSPGPVPLQYTPILTSDDNPSFYYVGVAGITVNGVAVKYPAETFQIASDGSGGLILDSGTTLTLLDTRVYGPLTALLQSLITYPLGPSPYIQLEFCYNVVGVANPTFPTVVFQLKNVNLVLPQDNILFSGGDDIFCLAFAEIGGFSILGNVAQQNFQVAYDRAGGRVGFAPRNC